MPWAATTSRPENAREEGFPGRWGSGRVRARGGAGEDHGRHREDSVRREADAEWVPACACPRPPHARQDGMVRGLRLRRPGSALCAAPGASALHYSVSVGQGPFLVQENSLQGEFRNQARPGRTREPFLLSETGPCQPHGASPAEPPGRRLWGTGGPSLAARAGPAAALGPSSSFPAASRPPGTSGRKQKARTDSWGAGWQQWQGQWQVANSPRGRAESTSRETRSWSLVRSDQWMRGTGVPRPGSAAHWLSDLGRVTSLLWAQLGFPISKKNSTHPVSLLERFKKVIFMSCLLRCLVCSNAI